MDDICRLCCSSNFVNNHIFDEENALYLKMSLYLPIKVFKNDRLPQKVCDKCSCKVNDFYQFCNETIEVQNRLRAVLISSAVEIEGSIDLTLIKQNELSPLPLLITDVRSEQKVEPNVDYDIKHNTTPSTELTTQPTHINRASQYGSHQQHSTEVVKPILINVYTQTYNEGNKEIPADNINTTLFQNVRVKEEPKPPLKVEEELPQDDFSAMSMFMCNDNDTNVHSDNSEDDISLIKFKKKKRSKKEANGVVQKKKKPKLKDWEMLMRALPEGTALTMVDSAEHDLKAEVKEEPGLEAGKKVKTEPVEFHCCICFVQCYSRSEMLRHYKEHAVAEAHTEPPAAPPPPQGEPAKCPRCQKRLSPGEWAVHWLAHWRRDARPYRCALCEKTFRDHHQILKHGLTHKSGSDGLLSPPAPPEKRFVCDQCPEGFVYMRYLLAHRASRHPEALGRPLLLRCPSCGRQFAHLNSLRRHLRAHSGERNFLCNVCGKALSSREHLKFHIRIHTGYKPNVCKTCGKGFVKKCNLTLHERVHSGEKPHVCSHCGKAFSQRSTLVIHERYHSGARPYVCALCGRGFVAKGLLSMHLKTTCI